jgi:uracil-DNA glycosylase family 4
MGGMRRNEIAEGLRKAMEFYRELGFGYLPVKSVRKDGRVEERRRENAEVRNLKSDPVVGAQHAAPLQPEHGKQASLQELREDIGDCTRCKLCRNRKNIVFGEGSPDAKIMFIGEGPGRDEDMQARPFVGEAGQLLTRVIEKMGLKRLEVYIANIVKCRPPNNREPDDEEIATCRPFVERQIEIIRPKMIVCLGKVATQSLLRTRTPISKTRGNFLDYKNIPVMPTFHPAYLLRNPKDKWLTWDDMKKVLERLKKN